MGVGVQSFCPIEPIDCIPWHPFTCVFKGSTAPADVAAQQQQRRGLPGKFGTWQPGREWLEHAGRMAGIGPGFVSPGKFRTQSSVVENVVGFRNVQVHAEVGANSFGQVEISAKVTLADRAHQCPGWKPPHRHKAPETHGPSQNLDTLLLTPKLLGFMDLYPHGISQV